MAVTRDIWLSIVVLNNFFANMCVKKKLRLTNQKPHRTSLPNLSVFTPKKKLSKIKPVYYSLYDTVIIPKQTDNKI